MREKTARVLDIGNATDATIVRVNSDPSDPSKRVDVYVRVSHGTGMTVVLVELDTPRGDIDVDIDGETQMVVRNGWREEY